MIIQTLKETESIHKIFGKVEIETIIKRIKGRKLKQVERNYLSRSIRPKLIASNILAQENILSKIGRPKEVENINNILFNLSKYGYELIIPYQIKKQGTIKLEELIVKILIKFPEARFIEAIPILLIKNKINPYVLLEVTIKYDLISEMGFLLETSFIIAKKFRLYKKVSYLEDLLIYFKYSQDKKIKFLGEEIEDKEYIEFLKRTSSKRMKKWNLLGRYFDDDFIKNSESYLR